jgi:predicted transcriptional regulator
MENFKEENQLQIELSDEVAQGTYSNLAIISHSTSEFVIDFIRIVPGISKAKVKSRIILTPEHAKRLLLALKENMEKFENMNGTINISDESGGYFPPIGGVGQA